MSLRTFLSLVFACFLISFAVQAEDWPMWRNDAGRTAASAEQLPEELNLQWTRLYPPRKPVWDDPLNQDLMRFDSVLEPIVMDGLVYLGFNDSDKVVALDLTSGEERWHVYLDGPARLPLAGYAGKIYATSDDGRLYCLDAKTGSVLWQVAGAPQDRKVLGNERLISTWPARGGAVVQDGTVYFTAGIWPFMGTFIYAVDAETGAVRWLNDGNGPEWLMQPHGAPSFAGVAPQGALVVDGNYLLVPGGRSVPACFDRSTGTFLHYTHAENNHTGGAFVCAADGVFFNHQRAGQVSFYQTEDANSLADQVGGYPVLTPDTYYFSGNRIQAVDAQQFRANPKDQAACVRWTLDVDSSGDLILAGKRLYVGGGNRIQTVDVHGEKPVLVDSKQVPGTVARLVAANGRLIVVTREGQVMAFGGNSDAPKQWNSIPVSADTNKDIGERARQFLAQAGVNKGYAYLYGVGAQDLAKAMLNNSSLKAVVIAPDALTVERVRGELDACGMYGARASVLQGDPAHFEAPPYLASLIVVHTIDFKDCVVDAALAARLFEQLRPYGGTALFHDLSESARAQFQKAIDAAGLPNAETTIVGDSVLLKRQGPLPDSASWTHYLGDVAQTGKSNDKRVKLPLGLLWFGGNSNEDVLPRHGHGPPEQVIGGRLFIEDTDGLNARDVYTGQVLWRKTLPELGTFGLYFNESFSESAVELRGNQGHIPGANMRGTNYAASADRVYVAERTDLLVLDAASGETAFSIPSPLIDAANPKSGRERWGYVGVYEDWVIGSTGFSSFSPLVGDGKDKKAEFLDAAASKRLAVYDRAQGKEIWAQNARHGFLHNGIAAGNGLIYALDAAPAALTGIMKRRGLEAPKDFHLMAFDVRTGEIRWENDRNAFGSFLAYSAEFDIVLQAVRASRDSLEQGMGNRMAAFQGADGQLLWDKEIAYSTFPLLHGARIIAEDAYYDLRTGEPLQRTNPITGASAPWVWKRQHGCNYPVAGEYMLTFRSGAAGFCDLAGSGGVGNFGGFKSGCTSNLVLADGVLNAPDYTRTCQCAYQNQTSLALVHDPAVEFWTYEQGLDIGENPILRLGVNFGAPGDRQADSGTLWLTYPVSKAPSPAFELKTTPENPVFFRHHSARMKSGDMRWVAASGVYGLDEARITLDRQAQARNYTVRLFFAEWEPREPGERVMDVQLQGKTVLENLDVRAEAGLFTTVIKEFPHVAVQGELTVGLHAKGTTPTTLCGIEVVAE